MVDATVTPDLAQETLRHLKTGAASLCECRTTYGPDYLERLIILEAEAESVAERMADVVREMGK